MQHDDAIGTAALPAPPDHRPTSVRTVRLRDGGTLAVPATTDPEEVERIRRELEGSG